MTDIVKFHSKYEEKVEGPCPQEECPTDRQISCVKFLIDQGDNPMVDLGLYTNYANRLRRRLAFSGFVPAEDGTLRKVEIRGPSDIETWTRHYRVYRANMIMLDAMGLNPLTSTTPSCGSSTRTLGASAGCCCTRPMCASAVNTSWRRMDRCSKKPKR